MAQAVHHAHPCAQIADISPASRVETLRTEALSHRAVRHPYLQALAQARLGDPLAALADFARLYHGYSSHFPRYLTAAISRLERPAHRRALIENLTEESGHYGEEELHRLEAAGIRREWVVGVPHPELFARFRLALGIEGDDGADDIEAVCWREMFHAVLIHGTPAEAIGAIGLGTETIVGAIYAPIVAALRRVSLPPEATVFFPLHCDVDDAHQATLKAIAIDLAAEPGGCEGLRRGMRKALSLRAAFWDHLLERAQGTELERVA